MESMQEATAGDRTVPASGRSWGWVWGLVIGVAVLTLLLGPLALVVLGAGLLAGGLWARHESETAHDRAVAAGLAAAGGAILVALALLLSFLMPARVTIDAGSAVDDVPVIEVEAPG